MRRRFAETVEAKRRRYKPGRFSFNVAGGRCPTCEGEGSVMVELLFLPSVYTKCPDCHGTRYQSSTLEILWRGKNVSEVLNLSVNEALDFFEGEFDIMRSLTALRDVGLGYLRLGQPATELSGGEAQRVKLATELQRAQRGDTLYVLDEPTTGLHCSDADRLISHLQTLVDSGNTVVMVELDMRIIAAADYVIDMGPGAGEEGGANRGRWDPSGGGDFRKKCFCTIFSGGFEVRTYLWFRRLIYNPSKTEYRIEFSGFPYPRFIWWSYSGGNSPLLIAVARSCNFERFLYIFLCPLTVRMVSFLTITRFKGYSCLISAIKKFLFSLVRV